MTRTFAVLTSTFCFLLGLCSLFITMGDCSAAIRVSVVTVVMVGLGQYLLNLANEDAVGIWVIFNRIGWAISGALLFIMASRVITSFQSVRCTL